MVEFKIAYDICIQFSETPQAVNEMKDHYNGLETY